MNWIPFSMLAEIAQDINTAYSHKRNRIHDVDISEDLLSIELVRSIREVLMTPMEDQGNPKESNGFHLSVQAYKATGGLERKHGDIAIVVCDIDLGKVGTGFYEAKLQSIGGEYPSFNLRQIQRLESNTPRLAIVMHEREKGPVSDDPFDRGFPINEHLGHSVNEGLCRVLPASWARKFRLLGEAAYQRRPDSFGYHFVTRYLLGRDLDYARSPKKAIARWVKKTRGASPLVVEIKISRTGEGLSRNEPLQIAPGSSQPLLNSTVKDVTLIQPELIPII
jgi:hypothetical protein